MEVRRLRLLREFADRSFQRGHTDRRASGLTVYDFVVVLLRGGA